MILRAAWIVPVSGAPLRDAYLHIDGTVIREITTRAPRDDALALDLGNAVIIPGLVNPHTHLELACYAGRIPPGPFWSWLTRLVELRRAPEQVERESRAAEQAAWASLRAGVTCVGDISRRNIAWPALKRVPIRKVCFVELLSLADHPPRDPEELRAAVESVEEDELLTAGITPHTPYTVPAEQIRAAVALAAELDRPWTTHLAETREEVAFLAGDATALPPMLVALLEQCGIRPPQCKPFELLQRCVGDGRPGTLVHLNYLPDEEIPQLAAAGHHAVFCPRAHRFFAHEPHPLPRLLEAGVPVAIGTDSPASNEGVSMLDELHHAHRHVAGAPTPDRLLEMATIVPARALGFSGKIGSLEPGKLADLAVFSLSETTDDPVRDLVERSRAPLGVWVAGRRVV